jgi:hypothetical protein
MPRVYSIERGDGAGISKITLFRLNLQALQTYDFTTRKRLSLAWQMTFRNRLVLRQVTPPKVTYRYGDEEE